MPADIRVTVKHSMDAGGTGTPTAADLMEVLGHVPPKAKVNIKQFDSQREGSSWTLSAVWDAAVQQEWSQQAPQFHLPQSGTPGARGGWDK